jgi:hypothetical protein
VLGLCLLEVFLRQLRVLSRRTTILGFSVLMIRPVSSALLLPQVFPPSRDSYHEQQLKVIRDGLDRLCLGHDRNHHMPDCSIPPRHRLYAGAPCAQALPFSRYTRDFFEERGHRVRWRGIFENLGPAFDTYGEEFCD